MPALREQSPTLNASWPSTCSPELDTLIFAYADMKDSLADQILPRVILALAIISTIINAGFVFCVVHGIRERILPFKGYSLLLNRSVTDLIVCFLTAVFVAARSSELVQLDLSGSRNSTIASNDDGQVVVTTIVPAVTTPRYSTEIDYAIPHGRTFFTLLLTVDFWSVALAYAMLAVFTYVAVRHPMYYKVRMTRARTIVIMTLVWVVGVAYSALVTTLSSNNAFNVFNSAQDLMQWTVRSEDFVLAVSVRDADPTDCPIIIQNLLIVVLTFVLVTGSYFAIVLYLYRKALVSGQANKHMVSIARLGLNIFAFACSCIVMAGFVSLPLFLKSQIDTLIAMPSATIDDECAVVLATYQLSYSMAVWTVVAMVSWTARMLLDPVANLLLDNRFKLVLTSLVNRTRRRGFYRPNDAQRRFLAANEFLRKLAEHNIMPISCGHTNGKYFRFSEPDRPLSAVSAIGGGDDSLHGSTALSVSTGAVGNTARLSSSATSTRTSSNRSTTAS